MKKKDFIEGVHYYLENGLVVFTRNYHVLRGYCCGNKCRHCAYNPRYKKGNKVLNNDIDTTQDIDYKGND